MPPHLPINHPSSQILLRRLRNDPLGPHAGLAQVPAVQVAGSRRQVRRESEPGHVGGQKPTGDLVDLGTPEPGQVAVDADEGGDVQGREDGPPQPEEERHPGQVQAQLDCVQGCALAGGEDC